MTDASANQWISFIMESPSLIKSLHLQIVTLRGRQIVQALQCTIAQSHTHSRTYVYIFHSLLPIFVHRSSKSDLWYAFFIWCSARFCSQLAKKRWCSRCIQWHYDHAKLNNWHDKRYVACARTTHQMAATADCVTIRNSRRRQRYTEGEYCDE